MKYLRLIDENKIDSMNKNEKKTFFIHLARFSFFVLLYLFYNILNVSNGQFINAEFHISAYLSFTIIFFNSILVLLNWSLVNKSKTINFCIMLVDLISVFLLIHLSQFSPSQFVFIYLAVVIFSGLLLGLERSIFIATLTCLLFNFNLITIDPLSSVLVYVMNNVSFILTAYLASSLSYHLSEMNFRLKKQEKEIVQVKNINSLIVNNMSSGVITTNNNDKVVKFNSSAKNLFNQLEVGLKIDDLLELGKSKKNDKGRFEIIQNLSGEKRILETIHSTLLDDDKQKKGQIFLIQDLTKIKKLEYAAKQQDKMAAVGQLAAGIAHEIRNPLASISGSVQLLESTSSEPENIKLFKIISKEIDRLNNLITEFLEFVRPDKVNEELVDLNSMIHEIMNMLKFNKQVRQDISSNLKLKSNRFIHADQPKLKQALLNIILNAYQAMESSDKAEISISTFDQEDKVVLQIADTGYGIKPETLNKIFEPFHTTKAKGTGLGLAITHKILENHNAKVVVESEINKGTVFTIEFPGKGDLQPKQSRVKKIA